MIERQSFVALVGDISAHPMTNGLWRVDAVLAHDAEQRQLIERQDNVIRTLRETLSTLVRANDETDGGLPNWATCWDDAKRVLQETNL